MGMMAGDLGITEGAVLLPERWPVDEALSELAPSLEPRHIFHEFGPRVRIAAATEEEEASDAILRLDVSRAPVPAPIDVDLVGAFGLAALQLRSSVRYVAMKADRPLAAAPWDTEEASMPDPPPDSDRPLPAGEAGAPGPAQAMRGRIGVGLVVVDGPTPDLIFNEDDRTLVVAEVQNGLGWYASQVPDGDLTWVYDIRPVTIDAEPDAGDVDFEPLEARFRDPALGAMGFSSGMAGVTEYVTALKDTLGVERAYCAFFTKYPVAHFAYATLGGPRLVQHFANDNWGPENLDRVFAHETGHIFGAPDEYAKSRCNCGGSWGTSGGPNSNCTTCAPGGGVPCIMQANDWALCSATPGHLGW